MYVIKYGLLMLMSLVCSSLLFAQSDDSSTGATASLTGTDKPYEVVITGRVTRAYLRDLIVDVEEDFFEKFNELNQDDTYDMYCYKYTPIMTHISERACEPLFMIKYRSDQSSNALFAISSSGDPSYISWLSSKLGSVYLPSEREMKKNMNRYYETLVEKMEHLTQTNQELAEIANVMEILKYRLENYSSN